MKIKAREGIILRDPLSKNIVSPQGLVVDDNDFFWARRVRDGDAIIVTDDPEQGDHS